ncbi:betaine/proline/choline family ABC transporter ATP-binding protein [Furfurilactobacillus siliginis]|uniref:Quaternary amine transport ATP-binding protein n=1 Tax=Furfurilactobacillus siliginis TaxID=348151 RepID=A0A0R2LA65_9LACO|nr:betaine/proline/choline family ABC transporter ATP-binding protein [Furfurilactobacillus siliginis]KRN96693.1 glycine betaine carnitine choline abc transporter, atp-binding protein [Furfurilactobacillus siliginis]GEK29464.1 glycine/betaine ABC transporter ATP-binding protein [Furfurilactobacillus siliginis]
MFLTMNHLNKTYAGNKVAVEDFNLEVARGEFICFIGTSGSGKTTTMRMINRMLHQTSGTIEIDGQDIAEMNPVQLRRRIGYVIQNIGLLPHMTIRDNITLVPRLLKWPEEKRNKRAKEMIDLVELPDSFLDRYPAELSGGQQQRIGVARALAADQDIILMDEAFSALDPVTRELLQDLVKNLQQKSGKTFVFVTHDMDEALKLATRIVVMSHGKTVQVATPEEILRHPANEFVEELIGHDRLIQAKPSITTVGQVMLKTPVAMTADQTMSQALKLMHERRVDTLLVTDTDKKLIGFVDIESFSDNYAPQQALRNIVNTKIFYVNENAVIRDTVDRILKHGYKNVPVVDDQQHLVGIVTRAALVDIVYDALFGDEAADGQADAASKAGV